MPLPMNYIYKIILKTFWHFTLKSQLLIRKGNFLQYKPFKVRMRYNILDIISYSHFEEHNLKPLQHKTDRRLNSKEKVTYYWIHISHCSSLLLLINISPQVIPECLNSFLNGHCKAREPISYTSHLLEWRKMPCRFRSARLNILTRKGA